MDRLEEEGIAATAKECKTGGKDADGGDGGAEKEVDLVPIEGTQNLTGGELWRFGRHARGSYIMGEARRPRT